MSINKINLLFCIARVFKSTLNVEICEKTQEFIDATEKVIKTEMKAIAKVVAKVVPPKPVATPKPKVKRSSKLGSKTDTKSDPKADAKADARAAAKIAAKAAQDAAKAANVDPDSLSANDNMFFYTKYATILSEKIVAISKKKISKFEITQDDDSVIMPEFTITYGKSSRRICLNHKDIRIANLIPKNLMKICGYRKNTTISKEFTESYSKLNDKVYSKIKSHSKYSEITPEKKESLIFKPVSQLLIDTISGKRKCSSNLFKHLFSETDRVVIRIYKSSFTIYDFSKDISETESFKMQLLENHDIILTFKNGVEFKLSLQTNAPEIKDKLSLKYHVSIQNFDQLFSIDSGKVKV